MGVLLYVLLCGFFPFKGNDEKELYRKIVKGNFEIPNWVGGGARTLICRMMRVNPLDRPDCKNVISLKIKLIDFFYCVLFYFKILNDVWINPPPIQTVNEYKKKIISNLT